VGRGVVFRGEAGGGGGAFFRANNMHNRMMTSTGKDKMVLRDTHAHAHTTKTSVGTCLYQTSTGKDKRVLRDESEKVLAALPRAHDLRLSGEKQSAFTFQTSGTADDAHPQNEGNFQGAVVAEQESLKSVREENTRLEDCFRERDGDQDDASKEEEAWHVELVRVGESLELKQEQERQQEEQVRARREEEREQEQTTLNFYLCSSSLPAHPRRGQVEAGGDEEETRTGVKREGARVSAQDVLRSKQMMQIVPNTLRNGISPDCNVILPIATITPLEGDSESKIAFGSTDARHPTRVFLHRNNGVPVRVWWRGQGCVSGFVYVCGIVMSRIEYKMLRHI
jgi:hypothetical protein